MGNIDQAEPQDVKLSRAEEAYGVLKQRILDNHYPPNHQMLEQQIALDLNVSRTPMREALIRLSQEGLIEVIPRHGFRVVPIAISDVIEIYDVLTALEPMAAELLAKRKLSHEELLPMAQATQDMKSALARDNLSLWATADEQFHELLMSLCGNKRLASMLRAVRDQSQRVRMITLNLREKPLKSSQEHRAVFDAISAGDSDAAHALHQQHRERVAEELRDVLMNRPIEPI